MTYRLVETKAPDGYVRPSGQWNVVFDRQTSKPVFTRIAGGCTATLPPQFVQDGDTGELSLPNPVFEFTKVDAHDASRTLQGAEFAVFEAACDTGTSEIIEDVDSPPAGWTPVGSATSDEGGLVRFTGLTDGMTIRLVETSSPVGYFTPTGQWNLTFDRSSTDGRVTAQFTPVNDENGVAPPVFETDEDTGALRVANAPLLALPRAGESGILPYLLMGVAVMLVGLARSLRAAKRRIQAI